MRLIPGYDGHMLATAAFTLQVVNVGLLIAGGLCCVGVLVWLVRSGTWRDPLADVLLPVHAPPLVGICIAALAYLTLQYFAVKLLAPDLPASGAAVAGSDLWHRFQTADGLARLLASVLMAVMHVTAHPRGTTRGIRLMQATGAGILGLLIVLPITAAQLELGSLIWKWLHPGAPVPMHIVLQGLTASEWGRWGTVQLLVGAILIAPVSEELFFRGIVLESVACRSRRVWPAILLSSCAFGAVHGQPQDIVPLVSMGIVLGYLRIRCGTLWPCILLHMLFNARTMITAVLAPELLQEQ